MKFYKIFLIIFFFSVLNSIKAQDKNEQDTLVAKSFSQYPKEMIKTDEFGNKYIDDERQKAKIYEIDGETVVVMDELIIAGKPHFNNQLDQNYYIFLSKKLNRVYPLFLTALDQYQDIESELKIIDVTKRKAYVRDRQNKLADEYESKLKDLTTSEGQIFSKLMNRATGQTVYQIIKGLRGGWSAFWWNVKGNIADVDIKEAYDPHANRVDEFIESLLQTSWNAGYLEPYPGYRDFKVKK